jgi:hypothetical protein
MYVPVMYLVKYEMQYSKGFVAPLEDVPDI